MDMPEPTHPQTQSSETVATRRGRSPTDLVNGKVRRHHSSLGVLLLNVAIHESPPHAQYERFLWNTTGEARRAIVWVDLSRG